MFRALQGPEPYKNFGSVASAAAAAAAVAKVAGAAGCWRSGRCGGPRPAGLAPQKPMLL